MKRKDYQVPTTRVVQLQHQCHILAGSSLTGGVTSTRSDYSENAEQEW